MKVMYCSGKGVAMTMTEDEIDACLFVEKNSNVDVERLFEINLQQALSMVSQVIEEVQAFRVEIAERKRINKL